MLYTLNALYAALQARSTSAAEALSTYQAVAKIIKKYFNEAIHYLIDLPLLMTYEYENILLLFTTSHIIDSSAGLMEVNFLPLEALQNSPSMNSWWGKLNQKTIISLHVFFPNRYTVLWIRIQIGSTFSNFVDPDPHN